MDLSALTNNVVTLTKEVGDFIRQEAAVFDNQRVEYKGVNDMVSYVDKNAEIMLVSELSKFLPESGFITEEKTTTKVGEHYNWIIDPLDGTTNFIHGIPTYSVSVALTYDGELVLGVVYEINRDECFYAWKEGGAYLNGKPIKVSNTNKLADSLLSTGFPYYNFEKHGEYMKIFSGLMQKCHGLRRIGSAAVDLAYVACGRFDGYFEYNLNDYDMAAGVLLVREAGGYAFDFSGGDQPLAKREVIATNALISEELVSYITKNFKAE
jgi:myo-inositol-1(or 4)-monophosphatase